LGGLGLVGLGGGISINTVCRRTFAKKKCKEKRHEIHAYLVRSFGETPSRDSCFLREGNLKVPL